MNTWDLTEQKHGTWWKDDLPTNEWKLTPKIHKRLTKEVEHTGNTTAINIMTHEEDKPNTGRDTVKIKQTKRKKTPEPGKKQTWGHRSRNGRRKQWHDWTQNTRGHTRLTEATWKYEGNVAREQGDETRTWLRNKHRVHDSDRKQGMTQRQENIDQKYD